MSRSLRRDLERAGVDLVGAAIDIRENIEPWPEKNGFLVMYELVGNTDPHKIAWEIVPDWPRMEEIRKIWRPWARQALSQLYGRTIRSDFTYA